MCVGVACREEENNAYYGLLEVFCGMLYTFVMQYYKSIITESVMQKAIYKYIFIEIYIYTVFGIGGPHLVQFTNESHTGAYSAQVAAVGSLHSSYHSQRFKADCAPRIPRIKWNGALLPISNLRTHADSHFLNSKILKKALLVIGFQIF